MPAPNIICPDCGKYDKVEKVSMVYLEGIGANKLSSKGRNLDLQRKVPRRLTHIPAEEVYSLSRKLTPPSSGKSDMLRPVHPDIIVLFFTFMLPFFITGLWQNQRQTLIPLLILLTIAYGLYFWQRKTIVAKFNATQEERKAAVKRVEVGIKLWMNLYYCARDDGVFFPKDDRAVPVEQMNDYLLHESQQEVSDGVP